MKDDYCLIPPLSEVELIILKSFDHHQELVMPEYSCYHVKRSEVHSALTSLTKKSLITATKPFKLTNLGKKVKHKLMQTGVITNAQPE